MVSAAVLATAVIYAGLGLVQCAPSPGHQSNVVDLGYARYRGNLSYPNTVAYLGLPYAEPPLGERRFRAPLPLNVARVSGETRGKVIDVSEYPDFCVQQATGGGAGSEDCLKVNVYAPAGAKRGDNLPVLVYIHGGGYRTGNPANWPFDHWIHQSPNVVIVSVYYRLSSFGFLAIPEFSDSSLGDFNVGFQVVFSRLTLARKLAYYRFQDQTLALKWVQENIAAFGGNKKRVTIDGESTGGGSVEFHLVSPGEEGLFSAAIAQSAARPPTPPPEQVQPLFDFFSENAGCGNGTVVEKMKCLRKASVSALARAQALAATDAFDNGYRFFRPVVDGKIITTHPTASLLAGDFIKVPVMVGSTSNETTNTQPTVETGLRNLFPGLDDQDIEEFLEKYPLEDFSSPSQQLQVATGESYLICARAAIGDAYAPVTNVWSYRYNQPNPTGNISLGTGHAAENWMMFEGINTGSNGTGTFTPMTPTETAFAEELIAYWLSFVRSHNPNSHKLHRSPYWEPYVPSRHRRLVLQQGPNGTTNESGSFNEDEPKKEADRCAFVISKADKEQN
ncbi:hypothetical protein D9758_003443 [Tetrapyrgos nigripes]|uniref:Carboxylic ester hydrolase n=1 Tax=Tetrapyrgos nigripes TaxID=182062 RepID=A0A8H5GVS2_9AGAR|nr:hypothetical protein D9758_003443 [Tetrapyrgos nigripes]